VTVDEVVAQLEATGYCIARDVLSPAEVTAARTDLLRVLAETPTGRNDFEGYKTQRIYSLFAKTRAFDKAALDPLVLGVLDQVLVHYEFSAPVGIHIGPGEKAQVLHRDDGIYPIARPHGDLVVNSMWALDDFTAERGDEIDPRQPSLDRRLRDR
jgi:ectoine hydroxylase-related dioxygenase (phytanoyl-CoA dioxygenase family)